MIDDIVDFIFEKVAPILFIGFIGFCIFIICCIPSCIKRDIEQENQVKECFMQDVKTKECEYILWKYELKKKEPKHSTAVIPMPIFVR